MGKIKPKEFITEERAREIRSEINELERQMRGGDDNRSDGVGFMDHTVKQVQDQKAIQLEINKRKRHLAENTPQPFKTVGQANKAYDWAKKAEKWIKEHAPQGNDVFITYPKPGNQEHDFDRSVKQMTEWLKKGDRVYSTYRYIMRRLDPKNPDAGRIRGI